MVYENKFRVGTSFLQYFCSIILSILPWRFIYPTRCNKLECKMCQGNWASSSHHVSFWVPSLLLCQKSSTAILVIEGVSHWWSIWSKYWLCCSVSVREEKYLHPVLTRGVPRSWSGQGSPISYMGVPPLYGRGTPCGQTDRQTDGVSNYNVPHSFGMRAVITVHLRDRMIPYQKFVKQCDPTSICSFTRCKNEVGNPGYKNQEK